MTDALLPLLDLLVRSSLCTVLALAAAAAIPACRPAERVAALRTGVCLLIALPLLMAVGPVLPLHLLPVGLTPAGSPAPETVWAGDLGPVAGVRVEAAVAPPSLATVAGWAWAVGALLVLGRFAVGVSALQRWTRTARPVTAAAWTSAMARLAGARPPRLLVSGAVPAPLSWGLPPGVVLLDPASLSRPETARAVLAHELAHVRNRDWLFLLLSRLALALFWFNPLVWRLHRELLARTEEAADAAALREVAPADYARALVSLAAGADVPAALAMAGPASPLARRIDCIMKTRSASAARPLVAALTVAGLVAVATPLAAVELAPRPPSPPQAPAAPPPPQAPSATRIAFAPPAPPAPPAPAARRLPEPPAPPAPPAPPQDGRAISDAERAELRAAAEQARAHAAEARVHAAAAREAALAMAAEARTQGLAAAAAGEHARAEAEVHAAAAHRAAARAMAQGRVEMARGADQMLEGARTMRTEGERLRDPAYRAEQQARARARGDRVPTDAELLDLSRRLPQQADELEAQSRRLREQAADLG